MDDFIAGLVEANSDQFTLRDESILKENLRQLEEKCRAELGDRGQKELFTKLWLQLVKLSVKLENIELSLLLTAKLKLVQLALLLRSTLQEPEDKENRLIALSYISSYFHIDHNNQSELLISDSPYSTTPLEDPSLLDHDKLVDLYVNRDDWDAALGLIDNKFVDEHKKDLNRRRVLYKLAGHYEIDEEFQDALMNYENSGTLREHCPRVIIKQFLNSSYQELEKYCSNETNLKSFWNEYSFLCGDYQNKTGSVNASWDIAPALKYGYMKQGLEMLEKTAFNMIPEKMREFISDTSFEKWASKKKLEYLISVGASLNTNTRAQLAELAIKFRLLNCSTKACGIYLCLDQPDSLLNLTQSHRIESLQLALKVARTDKLAISLVDYLSHHGSRAKKKDDRLNVNENQTLFIVCLKLGLIDEALQVLASNVFKDEGSFSQAIEHLEDLIEDRHNGSLDKVDPELQGTTLSNIHKSLESSQILSTHVITIVILSSTIFLLKLDTNEVGMLNASIPKLELLFQQLADYLDGLSFNASDALVRATSGLVAGVRAKLDALSDSDIIREGFRQLVESIAGRCMIESQYKSAAMLYSQIEDNISAVKSLMRIGDVDIVINYSLVARDTTVNRITINYLKHLGVDQTVIEDFIARSKQ